MLHNPTIGPRFPMHEAFDMCHPDFGRSDFATTESPVAGYFGTSSKVTTSAYKVPLKHGIPTEYDEERHQDGHNKCWTLCQREWSAVEASRFTKLVQNNYGYRMYLDDLPSATKYAGRDHYDESIPLGYVPEAKLHSKGAHPSPTGSVDEEL